MKKTKNTIAGEWKFWLVASIAAFLVAAGIALMLIFSTGTAGWYAKWVIVAIVFAIGSFDLMGKAGSTKHAAIQQAYFEEAMKPQPLVDAEGNIQMIDLSTGETYKVKDVTRGKRQCHGHQK